MALLTEKVSVYESRLSSIEGIASSLHEMLSQLSKGSPQLTTEPPVHSDPHRGVAAKEPAAAPPSVLPAVMVLPAPSEHLETSSLGSHSLDSAADLHDSQQLDLFFSPFPPAELTALPDEWAQPLGAALDTLVAALAPQPSQLLYRSSAALLFRKTIRATLGVVAYDLGLSAIRCGLPDDPIRLTAVLNQSQLAVWHSSLAERLRLLVDNSAEVHRLADCMEAADEGRSILVSHSLRGVNCLPMPSSPAPPSASSVGSFRVVCAVDSLDVELTANSRLELCLLEFLEELAGLVGQDALFKRSLLLLRAWWQHEAVALVGAEVRSCLSEQTLAVLLASVFNRFHAQIRHPLVALLLLLRELAALDGSRCALSLQGPAPYESDASSQPRLLLPPPPAQLVGGELLEKYWRQANLADPLNIDPPTGLPKPALDGRLRQEMLRSSVLRALLRFERRGFDVVHPLTGLNMVGERLSPRRLGLLQKSFAAAFSSLSAFLQAAAGQPGLVEELPAHCFPSLQEKFLAAWRPDALENAVALPPAPPAEQLVLAAELGLERLQQAVQFVAFIAESAVSESAILTFCTDLLTVRGPLPAGEVGKLLSEASSVQNLSHRLREKYGGLKKFLERFPETFVFSNDHPFNPHILLRTTLSADNLELIDRGIFPVHLISKAARSVSAPPPPLPTPAHAPRSSSPSLSDQVQFSNQPAKKPPAPAAGNNNPAQAQPKPSASAAGLGYGQGAAADYSALFQSQSPPPALPAGKFPAAASAASQFSVHSAPFQPRQPPTGRYGQTFPQQKAMDFGYGGQAMGMGLGMGSFFDQRDGHSASFGTSSESLASWPPSASSQRSLDLSQPATGGRSSRFSEGTGGGGGGGHFFSTYGQSGQGGQGELGGGLHHSLGEAGYSTYSSSFLAHSGSRAGGGGGAGLGGGFFSEQRALYGFPEEQSGPPSASSFFGPGGQQSGHGRYGGQF